MVRANKVQASTYKETANFERKIQKKMKSLKKNGIEFRVQTQSTNETLVEEFFCRMKIYNVFSQILHLF